MGPHRGQAYLTIPSCTSRDAYRNEICNAPEAGNVLVILGRQVGVIKVSNTRLPFIMDHEGAVLSFGGMTATIRVPGFSTAGAVAVVEHTLKPGYLGAPLHRHEREGETSYVQEGELTAQVGETVVRVGLR